MVRPTFGRELAVLVENIFLRNSRATRFGIGIGHIEGGSGCLFGELVVFVVHGRVRTRCVGGGLVDGHCLVARPCEVVVEWAVIVPCQVAERLLRRFDSIYGK